MIFGILILAFLLRLITLDQSLWLDEAINVFAAKNLSFLDFIAKYPIGDFHPPGYFAILWMFTRVFGFSEIAVRVPSVILGVATVYITYLLGKKLFDRKVAVLAALFLATAPLHVFYSQEARMYSLAAFSVALSSYFLLKLMEGRKWVVFYGLTVVLVLYSDYVAYLILPAHLLYVFLQRRGFFGKVILAWSLALVTFLPWMAVFPQQFMTGREASINLPGWKKVAGGADLKSLGLIWVKTLIGRISFENKVLYGWVVGALSLLWGVGVFRGIGEIRGIRGFREGKGLLLFWVLIPLVLAWGVSFIIPFLSYFRMIFILPAVYLLLAYGLTRWHKYIFLPSAALIIVSSIAFLGIYYTNPKFQRENWKGAVEFVENNIDDSSVVLFESNSLLSPYMFYSQKDKNALPGLVRIPAQNDKDVYIPDGKDKIYLFEYLVEITDPGRFLEKRLESKGFRQSGVYDFSGVGFVKLYRRL